MHWAYKIANELIERYPNKETYVCASGISPSGFSSCWKFP